MMHLHAACATHGVGLPEVQALLLAHPEAASATDGSGRTALHRAVGNNQVGAGIIEALVDAYPEAAEIEVNGVLPLLDRCAMHGVRLPEVQALLLAHPEAASATDGSGRTALHWAVGNNQVGIGVVEFITSMSNAVTNAKQIDAAHYKLFLSHVDRLHLDVLSTEELDGLKTQWNAMRMWSYEQHLLCPARFQSIVLTILLVLQHSCVESDRLGNRRVVDPRVFLERIVRALPPNDAVGMLYWPLE